MSDRIPVPATSAKVAAFITARALRCLQDKVAETEQSLDSSGAAGLAVS
ncbi:hypothetical protein [Streptomyces longispororuber]|nr:hypothetical protein [Streptomyces longispororuber]